MILERYAQPKPVPVKEVKSRVNALQKVFVLGRLFL